MTTARLPLLIVGLGLIALPALGQTALVAFRSHSGDMRTFDATAETDNFGLPYRVQWDSTFRLTDTSAVRYQRRYSQDPSDGATVADTIYYREPPSPLFELRRPPRTAKPPGMIDQSPAGPPKPEIPKTEKKRKARKSVLLPGSFRRGDDSPDHPAMAWAAVLVALFSGWAAWRSHADSGPALKPGRA